MSKVHVVVHVIHVERLNFLIISVGGGGGGPNSDDNTPITGV